MPSFRFWILTFFSIYASSLLASPTDKGFLFIENKGQWHEDILFRTSIPSGVLLIKKDGLEYMLYQSPDHFSNQKQNAKKSFNVERVGVKFKNAILLNPTKAKTVGTSFNYFIGKDQSNWRSNVKAHRELLFENVLNQIDFRIYSKGESIKYEFIVHSGGKPEEIKIQYKGLNTPQLDNRSLKLRTSVGLIKEFPPFTYQIKNSRKQEVKSSFVLKGHDLSFDLDAYDTSEDIIIDPELVFSTFSGSISDNWSQTATYDDEGNLFAGGTAFGPLFPISPSAYQQESQGATISLVDGTLTEVVIQKYSKDGSELLYSTYLGGEFSEVPHSLIANSRGELVIMGTTSSSNFPTTARAYSSDFNGGDAMYGLPITTSIDFPNGSDLFVAILSKDGDQLLASTFLGGSGNDGIHNNQALKIQNYGDEFRGEVYVDKDDKIYIASTTNSKDFPVVKGKGSSNSNDAVVCRFSRDLSRLEWSTHLAGRYYDAAYGLRVDNKGDVFVVGSTISDNIGATGGAYQNRLNGEMDGFLAKFSNDELSALTYFGTNDEDLGMFIDLDADGNVYVFGLTIGNYPVSSGVYRNMNSGQFIHSFSNDLSTSLFSTVFGTSQKDVVVDIVPTAFLVNSCGNIYVAGWGGDVNSTNGFNPNSSTNGLPVTQDAFMKETNGSNFYFAIFEAKARSLLFGTFFGSKDPPVPENRRGDHLDGGTCRFDKNGIIYHSACVCRADDALGSLNFPLENAFETNHGSNNCNMAAFKFDISKLKADFNIFDGEKLNPEIICNTSELKLKNESSGAITYEWSIDGKAVTRLENFEYMFPNAGVYEIQLAAYNNLLCSASDSVTRRVEVIPFPIAVSQDTSLCPGGEALLKAIGGNSYEWSPSELFQNPTGSEVSFLPSTSQEIEVTISNELCIAKKIIKVDVSNDKEDFITTDDLEICSGQEITLEAYGQGLSFLWNGEEIINQEGQSLKVKPTKSSVYSVQATYNDGCVPTKSISITIDESFKPSFLSVFEYDCGVPPSLSFDFVPSEKVVSYQWAMGNLDSLQNSNPRTYRFKSPGQYLVKLDAYNRLGCKLSTEELIDFPDDDGIIPNAISPNGDGKNETFIIGAKNASLNIYNRWGKLIYEKTNYLNDWGQNVPPDVYFYEIVLNNNKVCKGWVEVFN